jgi:hypothetical protein
MEQAAKLTAGLAPVRPPRTSVRKSSVSERMRAGGKEGVGFLLDIDSPPQL